MLLHIAGPNENILRQTETETPIILVLRARKQYWQLLHSADQFNDWNKTNTAAG